jgi:hypothetical protein
MEQHIKILDLEEEFAIRTWQNIELLKELQETRENIAYLTEQLSESKADTVQMSKELSICKAENENMNTKLFIFQSTIMTLVEEFNIVKEKEYFTIEILRTENDKLMSDIEFLKAEKKSLQEICFLSEQKHADNIKEVEEFYKNEISSLNEKLVFQPKKLREAKATLEKLKTCEKEYHKIQIDYNDAIKKQNELEIQIIASENQKSTMKEMIKKQLDRIRKLDAENKELTEFREKTKSIDATIPQIGESFTLFKSYIAARVTEHRKVLPSNLNAILDILYSDVDKLIDQISESTQKVIDDVSRKCHESEFDFAKAWNVAESIWKIKENDLKVEITKLKKEVDILQRDASRSHQEKRRR